MWDSSIDFIQPEILLLFLPFLFFLRIKIRSQNKALFTGVLLIGSLLLALSHPLWNYSTQEPRFTYFCIDNSTSLSNQERDALQKQVQIWQKKLEESKLPFHSLFFGETVESTTPSSPSSILNPQSLEEGLEMALALSYQKGIPAQVVLGSDASQQSVSDNLLKRYQKAEIPIYFWSPPPRTNEWQLLKIATPPTIEQGEAIPFTIDYRSNFSGELDLEIFSNGKPYWKQTILAQVSREEKIIIEAPPLKAGNYFFELKAQGDSRVENNQGVTSSTVTVPSPVLFLSQKSESILVKALEAGGIQVDQSPILPKKNKDYSVILLDNPPTSLISSDMNEFWSHHLGQGGGVLLLGKGETSPSWSPGVFLPQEPNEEEKTKPSDLPKKPDIEPKEDDSQVEIELRSAALVILIDRSGSMTGEKLELAQQAALFSIARLWYQDMVGVVIFDTEAQWLVPLGRGIDIEWTARRLKSITPGGGTVIAPALEKAYHALNNVSAQIKHVILLSDGRDDEGVFAHQNIVTLAKQMQKNNISITTIGVGTDFDAKLLPTIAKWGSGKFYFANNYNQIPVMMLRDVDRVLKVRALPEHPPEEPEKEKPFIPIIPLEPPTKKLPPPKEKEYPVEKTPSSIVVKEFLEFPTLPDYYTYQPKKQTQLELEVGSSPLLLHWHQQLGKVALWTSDTKTWGAWSEYSRFWSTLVSFLKPDSFSDFEATLQVKTHSNPQKFTLELFLADHFGKEISGMKIESEVAFERKSGLFWRKELPLTLAPKTYIVELFRKNKKVKTLEVTVAKNYSEEFADLTIQEDVLEKIAEVTKGGKLDKKGKELWRKIKNKRSYELDDSFLLLALGLLLLFIWQTRVD